MQTLECIFPYKIKFFGSDDQKQYLYKFFPCKRFQKFIKNVFLQSTKPVMFYERYQNFHNKQNVYKHTIFRESYTR